MNNIININIFKKILEIILVIFIFLAISNSYADFEVISPSEKHYSDKYRIGTGSYKTDNGTVYAYGYKSGTSLKVYIKTASGKKLLQNSRFVVYQGSISSSNEVARTDNLKGLSSASVTFTPEEGDFSYKALLATETSDGTEVGFYINDPIVIKYQAPAPTVSTVSPSTGKVDESHTYTIYGSNLSSTLAFTIANADCSPVSTSSTRIRFNCTPRRAGNMDYIVKDKSGGTALKRGTINVENLDPNVLTFKMSPSSPRKFSPITFTATSDITTSNVKFKCGSGDWQSSSSSNSGKTWTYTRSVGLKENTTCYVDIDNNGSADDSLSVSLQSPKFELSNSNPSPRVNDPVTFNVLTDSIESGYVLQIKYLDVWNSMTSSNRTNWSHERKFSSAGNKTIYYRIIRESDERVYHSTSSSISVTSIKPKVVSFDSNPPSPRKFASIVFTAKSDITTSDVKFKCGGGDWKNGTGSDANKTWVYTRSVGLKENTSCFVDIDGDGSADETLDLTLQDPKFELSNSNPFPKVNELVTFKVVTDVIESGYSVQIQYLNVWNIMTSPDHRTWSHEREFSSAGPKTIQYRIIRESDNKTIHSATSSINVSVPAATISEVSPLVGEVNTGQVYTVTGNNLPSSLVFSIEGADDCEQRSHSLTSVSFYCIPRVSGQKTYVLKDSAEGEALKQAVVTIVDENYDSIVSYLSQDESVVAEILSAKNLSKALSRAEASILLDVFLSKQNPSYKKDMSEYPKPFADADNSSDYYLAVKRLAYFKGIEDSETVLTKENALLRPLDEVLRQEFVKMMVQGIDLPINRGSTHVESFTDYSLVHDQWPEDYFNTAVAEGLIVGDAGYLKPLNALTIEEALIILKRAMGKTSHDSSGFEASGGFDTAQLLLKVIGYEYEPAYYQTSADPINITNLSADSPNSSDKSNCGVTDGSNFKVLTVSATTDSSNNVHEYYWWSTNFGYFRQYGSDEQFKKVCFFPATTQPTIDYQVIANGGDNIGFVSRKSIDISATDFTYGNGVLVDVPSNQIADIQYSKSASIMRAGSAFSLDFNNTTIEKAGVNLGIEHIILRLIVDGEKHTVFSGQPTSGVATFIVPDSSEFYGKNTKLEITLNTQQIKAVTTTEEIKFLPRFVVGGKVFNAGTDNNVSTVKVGSETIALDENNEFYVELDSQSEILSLNIEVVGGVEANAFDTEIVDLTFEEPRAFIAFVGEDQSIPVVVDTDSDEIDDYLDNCPNVANADQADLDGDGVGNVCDDDRDGDGQPNDQDAFPEDKNEWLDTDSDGAGNNADPDDDNDGLSDIWESTNGLNPTDASDANVDSDDDGYTNLQEYENGSDPQDDTSIPIQKWQHLSLDNCNRLVSDSELTCDVLYTTSDNNPNLTGIGFQLHFDANKLQWLGVDDIYSGSLFDTSITPSNDVADGDSDALTSEYVLTGWAGLQSQWPGEVLPVTLFTAKFKANENLTLGDSTTIRFSPVDTADGYGFKSEPKTLTVQNGCTLDVDEDGQSRPLTDGLLLLRYQFGFRDSALLNGAVSGGAKRSDASGIQTYLEGCSTDFDIDGSGDTRPLTDGLLTLRYLFGFRDDALINGAVSEGAKRSDAATITNYLQQYH